ncbi:TlpA disulfide reductase family protein [Anseongella ginsenosidimutans]|nr:TlpA disulfide reductase family protein [Anseongella ginsenosidimutans]QEC52566.1 redoxin domain-containing protein [Anseongella ginsenosidimutans]
MKSLFSFSNIITAILVIFGAALFFSPALKGAVLRGLVETGLFQPSVPGTDPDTEPAQASSTPSSVPGTDPDTEPAQASSTPSSVPGTDTEPAQASSAQPSSIQQGSVLFKSAEGELIDLSRQQGKVVFINFWATWCPPCIAEMPSIQKLYSAFKDDEKFLFLMVDVDNKPERSLKFMQKGDYDLPVHTPASAIPPSFLGGAIPTTLVLDKKGEVVFKHEGMGDYSAPEFQSFMKELAAK